MRRAFDIDVLACPRCGGRLRLIAAVEDPEAIRAIWQRSRCRGSGPIARRRAPRRGTPATGMRSAPERRLGAAAAEVCSLPPERFCIPVEWPLAHPGIP
jgi:hypothetical protein